MSRLLRLGLVASIVCAFCVVALADARGDVQIRQETDEKKYTIYKLVNNGKQPVRTKVKFEKQCSGVANNQEPTQHEYVLAPGASVELGRVWPQSTCKRSYRVVEAEYPAG
jgi:hypothetical protein